ncbi:unnamed protein product [Rhizoctonia solani]|uniref:Uncharacterized protein n=1 Tax=Rhizoctonia solani TaxID=456999 RepID=A0A8H2XKY0_9AGAM|nr:unnamed protein product [Rhizoctonia solani]
MSTLYQIPGCSSIQPTYTNGETTNSMYDSFGNYQRPRDVNRPQLRVVTSYAAYLHLATPPHSGIASPGSSPGAYTFQTSKRASRLQNTTPRVFSRSRLPSPSPSDIGSAKSSPRTEIRSPPSPTSSSSESSTSGKSVRWGGIDEQGHIGPGQYSARSPKSPSKTVLKHRELKAANMPSLFAENTPIVAASVAMDSVLCELVTCSREFKCPSELDFSVNTGSPLILANVEKNQAFISQLRKLDELRTRLAEIPTHGNAQLMNKHKAAGEAIRRAFQKMKKDQLSLYDTFERTLQGTKEQQLRRHERHTAYRPCLV